MKRSGFSSGPGIEPAAILAGFIVFAINRAFAQSSADVYVTARDTGQRLAKAGELSFEPLSQPVEARTTIIVDSTKTFQSILGIGGALTDAAAETFCQLPADKQQEFLTAYFDPKKGIGYTLGRTSINSCDFSSDSYTYVAEGDTNLTSFDIRHDEKYRIPFIKRVLETAGPEHFTLFASPWSPPAWMKDNHDLEHGGRLRPEFYGTWANYFAKFIQAYQNDGIRIWGCTVQNEPLSAQTWESCQYTAAEERDFLKSELGPTLTRAGLADRKILIWDHNRNLMYQRAKVILDDPQAAQYVWGMAYHWYMSDSFDNVKRVHEAYPAINLMLTEGCNGPFDARELADWKWGERYGRSMINDFNNGAVGWTDWNVLLDQQGGPNHVQNYCFAPVHADVRAGTLYYMNSFYYIGHFSKFVRPGAKRITCSSTADNLPATAFLNPDGKISVIVMNPTGAGQPFDLWMNNHAAQAESPPHSIETLVVSGDGP